MKTSILFILLISMTFVAKGESDGFYSVTQKIESILSEAASCSGDCKEEHSFNVDGFDPVQMQTYFRVAGYESKIVDGTLIFDLSEKIADNSKSRDEVVVIGFLIIFVLFIAISAQRVRFGQVGSGVSQQISRKSIM